MSPRPRLPDPTFDEGVVVDPRVMGRLVSGRGQLNPEDPIGKHRWGALPWVTRFWKDAGFDPEPPDLPARSLLEDDIAKHMVAVFRAKRQARTTFLIENGYLGGPALERALGVTEMRRKQDG
jgi:hypothetical protein